jgi:hypothetical protein
MNILGYGSEVKVLMLLHYKKQVKELIEQMLLKYK